VVVAAEDTAVAAGGIVPAVADAGAIKTSPQAVSDAVSASTGLFAGCFNFCEWKATSQSSKSLFPLGFLEKRQASVPASSTAAITSYESYGEHRREKHPIPFRHGYVSFT